VPERIQQKQNFTGMQDSVIFAAKNPVKIEEASSPESKQTPQKLSILKSLGKGFIAPIKEFVATIKEHAAVALPLMLGLGYVIRRFKQLGAALSLGMVGYGAIKSTYNSAKSIKAIHAERKKVETERDYTKANQHIQQIGEGVFDVGLGSINSAYYLNQLSKAPEAAKSTGLINTLKNLKIRSMEDIVKTLGTIKDNLPKVALVEEIPDYILHIVSFLFPGLDEKMSFMLGQAIIHPPESAIGGNILNKVHKRKDHDKIFDKLGEVMDKVETQTKSDEAKQPVEA
jgi:hypothetical protein